MQSKQKILTMPLFLLLSCTISIVGMDQDSNDSELENFFDRWKGNEYHAYKFVDDTKYSSMPLINYYNDGVKIATFNKEKKEVITYLNNGYHYKIPYEEFKKRMQEKLHGPTLYNYLLSILCSLLEYER